MMIPTENAAPEPSFEGRDREIFTLIRREFNRQKKGLELIASENFVSQQVLDAMGSCLTNKYAEGLPGKRYYGGCEVVDEVEQLAIDRACALFNASWANVQPHSGSQANASVMLACLKPGDTILGFDLSHGGHLTHGSPVNFSGRLYRAVFYGVEQNSGLINYRQLEEQAHKERPKLIICGASAYSRDWDYARFRAVADSVGALLMADIAHPAGLIARGLLNDPMPHCHFVTTTTHKTLRGPRGGMVMMGQDFENPFGIKTPKGEIRMMSSLLDSAVFPGTQGGPLEHVIAGKAVAFREAMTDDYFNYCLQVVKNARVMATAFMERGYQVVSGGTDNHMMLIDLRPKNISGKEADKALVEAHITVNKNMVPFDDKSPMVTSGIRVGTAALTTRGMREEEMKRIVELMDRVITNAGNRVIIKEVQREVKQWAATYPL